MSEDLSTILVVDDSVQVCKTLGDVLGTSGYAVRTAPSAERALQMMESADFDLIITDLKMSGMSGMDLAEKVFAQRPGLPVVILSGFGDMDSVINALRSGVTDFIKKPFAIDEVLSVVDRAIGKHRTRMPAVPAPAVEQGEKPARLYAFAQREREQIEAALTRLRTQTSAELAMLIEEAGYVVAAKGLGSESDFTAQADLIIGTRSSSAVLASLLGETQDFTLGYLEGQRVSVYTTALGLGLYLVVIVPKGTKQGLVQLYTKETATEIDKIVQRVADSALRRPARSANVAVPAAAIEPVNGDKAYPKNQLTPPEIKPMPSTVSTITFKKGRSVPEVKSTADAALDQPATASTETSEPASGETLSFEEAQQLGLHNFGDQLSSQDQPSEAEEKPEPEAQQPTITFEEALKRGLLNFDEDK